MKIALHLGCFVAMSLLDVVAPGYSAALTATTASDVCATNADPCVVTDVVHVTQGAVLDFAGRDVQVTGGGQFDFGTNSAKIYSGDFTATTQGDAIVARGRAANGGTDSGAIAITAERQCSATHATGLCTTDNDCQLGTCTARRCSLRYQKLCAADTDCSSGTCSISRRCSNAPGTTLRCTTNEDCNFGTCPEQLSCSVASGGRIRSCDVDSDCQLGSCTVGEASIAIEGSIDGHSDSPALITLLAADSVTVSGSVDLSATAIESDGGDLEMEAQRGDAILSGRVRARSGGLGEGGNVFLEAGQDAIVTAPVDLAGGDYGGGYLDVEADRDAVLRADVNLSAKSGAGYGGWLDVIAERDIHIGGSTDGMRIQANGHANGTDGGGGGQFYIDATRNIDIGADVDIRGTARGEASTLDLGLQAGGDLHFAAKLNARARGPFAGPAYLTFYVDGDLDFAAGSKIDARGGYGGILEMVSSLGDTTLDGSILFDGASDYETGSLELEACDISLGGTIRNLADDGYVNIVAYESLSVASAGTLAVPKGDIRLVARTSPSLDGQVSPVPLVEILDYGGCQRCGNSVIDPGETCDDGNETAGDGCDELCLIE